MLRIVCEPIPNCYCCTFAHACIMLLYFNREKKYRIINYGNNDFMRVAIRVYEVPRISHPNGYLPMSTHTWYHHRAFIILLQFYVFMCMN